MSHQATDAAGAFDAQRPIFSFSYRSIPFRVHVRADGDDMAGMLKAVIGVVPFTVDGNALRRNMLAVLRKARETDGYEIAVGADHAISLSVILPVDSGSPPDAILAAALERLAAAKAFLDLVQLLQPPHLRNATPALSQDAA